MIIRFRCFVMYFLQRLSHKYNNISLLWNLFKAINFSQEEKKNVLESLCHLRPTSWLTNVKRGEKLSVFLLNLKRKMSTILSN